MKIIEQELAEKLQTLLLESAGKKEEGLAKKLDETVQEHILSKLAQDPESYLQERLIAYEKQKKELDKILPLAYRNLYELLQDQGELEHLEYFIPKAEIDKVLAQASTKMRVLDFLQFKNSEKEFRKHIQEVQGFACLFSLLNQYSENAKIAYIRFKESSEADIPKIDQCIALCDEIAIITSNLVRTKLRILEDTVKQYNRFFRKEYHSPLLEILKDQS